MISTKDEATAHAQHVTSKKHVVVLPDGSIYAEDEGEKLQPIVDATDCFVVKGDLKKKEKAKKRDEKEIKE